MEITRDYLKSELAKVVASRERARMDCVLYDGAAQAIENLIARMDDAMTLDEFQEVIGAESVELDG